MQFKDLNILDVGDKLGMTGMVLGSNDGTTYLCMLPTQPFPAKNVPLMMDLEDWKRMVRQLDLQETEIIAKSKENGELVKVIVRKSQRTIEQRVSWAVYHRDGYRCRYCADTGIPLTVDHLILWEDGGPSTEENLVTACRPCNKARADMPYEAWLKSDQYWRSSAKLTEEVRQANQALVAAIKLIQRRYSVRETRK